jgi:murein L,D-transpeptidase YafK
MYYRILTIFLLSFTLASADRIKADKILVSKRCKYMFLMKDGKVIKRYHVVLGRDRIGHKQKEGDHRTPEGVYNISEKNSQSKFYKALRVSYPNTEDAERAAEEGVSPGGDIMIHGIEGRYAHLGNPYIYTRGCIAVANNEMDEVWSLVDRGTTIEIRP